MTPQEMDRLVQQLGDDELQVFAFARLVQVGQRTLPFLRLVSEGPYRLARHGGQDRNRHSVIYGESMEGVRMGV